MNKTTKQFKQATQHITLSKNEKALMREQLVAYMEYKPIRREVGDRKLEEVFSFFRIRHYSGAFMIAILVLSSTFGVSFAAGGALPGDLLYGFKVNVNEEIKTVFINSESRLAWDQERAERRLVEASQLAAEGRFDDKAQKKVSQLFAEHTEAVVEQVLAYEETDPVLAAEASGSFEDSLETHEAVLARVMVDGEEEPDQGAKNLVEQVRTATMEVEKLREVAEEKIEITEEENEEVVSEQSEEQVTTEDARDMADSANMRVRAAYRAKERAEALLEEAEALYMEREIDSQLRIQAEAQTAYAKIFMDKGESALVEYELSEAYSNYKKASGILQKVSQLLEVANLFSIEIYQEEVQTETEQATQEATEMNVEEEQTNDEVLIEIQTLQTRGEETISQARTLLLTMEGFDMEDVEEASGRIKNAEAFMLRGEIALVLKDFEDAKKLYTKAIELGELTVETLERQVVEDNVKGVSTMKVQEENNFELTHTFAEGVHTFMGEVATQGACETLEGISFVSENSPEEISLEINVKETENEEGCIEVVSNKEFLIKTTAKENAVLTSVSVNGEPVKWNLVKAEVEEVHPEVVPEETTD